MQLLLSGVAHRNQGLFSDYYLDYPDNGLNATPEICKLIYDNSLTLLYQLLFILYSEARDLLPLHSNSTYQRRYSLHSIKNDVASSLQKVCGYCVRKENLLILAAICGYVLTMLLLYVSIYVLEQL
jgi:hypothetical protein